MKKICILDYGSGNVRSVFNMLSNITGEVIVSNKSDDISSATHLVLPGVGSFGASMEKIKKMLPLDVLEEEVLKNNKPFLGICVGLQVLAEEGVEFGDYQGLGWIRGTVERMQAGSLPLPHIGWNSIDIVKQTPLLKKFGNNQDFYFVHSYVFKAEDSENVVAKTEYGEHFSSIINKDNIYGVQFHPEKSQKAGRILFENFLEIK